VSGFIIPTLVTVSLPGKPQKAVITSPAELDGREVVQVDGQHCLEPCGGFALCGLIRNHHGQHWACDVDLLKVAGPFAMLREMPDVATKTPA